MDRSGPGAGAGATVSSLPLLLPLLLSSCFSYQEVTFKGITDVQVSRMDEKGIAVRAMVTLDNPNGFRIHVNDPDVDVYLNDVYIGKAILDSNLTIDKRISKDYAVPMHATFNGHGGDAMVAILGAALSGHAKLKAKGSVSGKSFLFSKRFPFEQETELDLGGR